MITLTLTKEQLELIKEIVKFAVMEESTNYTHTQYADDLDALDSLISATLEQSK